MTDLTPQQSAAVDRLMLRLRHEWVDKMVAEGESHAAVFAAIITTAKALVELQGEQQ